MSAVKILLKKMYEDVVVPKYAKKGDAAMDLRAHFTREWLDKKAEECLSIDKPYRNYVITTLGGYIYLEKDCSMIIPTGIQVAVPSGYEMQIRPRSGLAAKNGVTVLNSPGTIDSGYRGEIGVILINFDRKPFKITHGDRIAQMIVKPVPTMQIQVVKSLPKTSRGEDGFGSTGV